jgi:sulfur-oxidizing protein SoxB
MFTRRDFLQYTVNASIAVGAAAGFSGNFTRALAQQKMTQDDLLKFDSKGQVTLLHFTDVHAQLKPIYFRPPDTNIGVGDYAGIPPHLVLAKSFSSISASRQARRWPMHIPSWIT